MKSQKNIQHVRSGSFHTQIKHFFKKRLYLLFWVGFIFFPLFSVLDYFVFPYHFKLFLMLRIMVALSFLVLLLILSRPGSERYPFPIGLTGLAVSGSAISAMIVMTGGYHSLYYVGMICLLVAFTTILPLNLYQAIGSGLTMLAIYILPVLIFTAPGPGDGLIFFSNNFFFLFFFIVSVVKGHEDYELRKNEFQLRKNLNFYAGNLEQEVRRRIKKQEESELKYKELYENIMDSLVVLDSKGTILIANPKFYQKIGEEKRPGKEMSFFDFVHREDIEKMQHLVMDVLFNRNEIDRFHFKLLNSQDRILDMECSAKRLMKSGEIIGFQLVLRDITSRKRLEKDLIASFSTLKDTRAATIMGLAKLTEYRDNETGNHLERIREYSRVLTRELAGLQHYASYLKPQYVDDITLSSILHDIGKVGIPDAILLKPGRLSAMEFEIIKKHCQYGGDALKAVEARISGESFLTLGREIAYFHHEKWDGTGYPNGLKNSRIPLSARIVAVCDVYDALTSKRIYKESYSHDTAVEIIQSERGRHFDPRVTDTFLEISNEFNAIRKQL